MICMMCARAGTICNSCLAEMETHKHDCQDEDCCHFSLENEQKHVYFQIQYNGRYVSNQDGVEYVKENMSIHSDGCVPTDGLNDTENSEENERKFLHDLLDEWLDHAAKQGYPNEDEDLMEMPHFLLKICSLHREKK